MPPIYLDCHATTPTDPRVVEAMRPYFTEQFGNPGAGYAEGWAAAAAVAIARETVAAGLSATPEEIVWTSGATEANNLAIKGAAEAYLARGRHLVTVQTEHSAVLEPCRYLQRLGFEVTYLPVQPDGLLDLSALAAALRPDTVLVSVMAANNEIGVLQSLAEIGALTRDRGILFHADAAQAFGKIPLDVGALGVDLLSLTAHKLYGPKGIGALYVRRGVRVAAQLHGGGQEGGIRSGTLPVPSIVGLGAAAALALAELDTEAARLRHLRDRLWSYLAEAGVQLNGHPTRRLPGNLNVSVPDADGATLFRELQPQVAVSSGSACSGGEASHVLRALGHDKALARASVRFGLGRFTAVEDIDRAAAATVAAIAAARQAPAGLVR